MGKGLPSINTSSTYTVAQAKIIAQSLNLSNGDYRKGLSKLRKQLNLMEIDLREEGETEQPSKTMVQEDAPPSYAHMMEALGVERYKAIVA